MRTNIGNQSRISKSTTTINKQTKPVHKHKNSHYLELSNEEYLRRNLMLLGVTQPAFLKETKSSLDAEFFPKHQTNPTATKQFFYISFICLQKLTNSDQITDVQMWYPPRTVNEQLQYKKAFFKAIQNLQLMGRAPKNIIVSKGTIMGDSTSTVLVQFLRFLSELALRHQYIQKYSKKEKLIQICCNHTGSNVQNHVNKFYIHPFVPSSATTSFDHPSVNLPLLKQVYHDYLKIYIRKLVKLRTNNIDPVLAEPHQDIIKKYMEQKQLSQTLSQKIPNAILSENRAFDRRRLIDRNQEIWHELEKLQCNFIEAQEIPILKIEGQVDQILQKWQPVKGISNILQANSYLKNVPKLKQQLADQRKRFKQLCDKITAQINK